MATVRDKLKRARVGGALQEMSQEELGSLSEAAGRAAPPIQPLEAGVIGGTPDQAKMAGTAQQRMGAIRVGLQEAETLQERMRRGQVRRTGTEAEQEKLARGTRLEQLGGLQSRVQGLTEQMIQQAAGTESEKLLQLNQQNLSQLPEERQAQVQELLSNLQEDPSNPQLLKQLNNALGITRVENMLTADNLQQYFQDVQAQTAAQTAAAFQDQATVEDLNLEQLGFTDIGEVASLLGMDPEEVRGLSVRQLIQEAEAQVEEEFTTVADLQRRAQDPNLGPAERAEARRMLREMGATGIRAAESDIDKMAEQIATADTVEFGGEEVTIEELLDDEYLSGLTARYLQASEDDPFRAQLEKNEPELTKWIQQNQAVLQDAVQQMEEGLSDFAEIQYENRRLADIAIGEDLSDDIMSNLLQGWGEIQSETYEDRGEVPEVLRILNDPQYNKNIQTNIYEGLQTLQEADPALTQELATLSKGEMDALGITAGNNSDKFSTYKSYLTDISKLESADPTSAESVASAILGPGKTWADLQSTLSESSAIQNSGLFGPSPISWLQDLRGKTPAEALAIAKNKLLEEGKPKGLREAIANTPKSIQASLQGFQSNYNKAQLDNQLGFEWDSVKDAFANDSKIDRQEFISISQRLRNADDLEKMYDKIEFRRTMSPEAISRLRATHDARMSPEFSKITGFSDVRALSREVAGTRGLSDMKDKMSTFTEIMGKLDAAVNSTSGLEQEYWKKAADKYREEYKLFRERKVKAEDARAKSLARQLEREKDKAKREALLDTLAGVMGSQTTALRFLQKNSPEVARELNKILDAGKGFGKGVARTGEAVRRAVRRIF